ncbi:hypothetical protein WS9_010020 [Paraclostridium sordellii 8483]|uniref:hypothetical protein n=1 Tax=Paraclostridium sordellii TaxID=1505 RepID=UPI0002F581A4|nr:hypothetical protein [Paeniclostridium sordellii]TAN66640.1 hypothetical protein WS9_010020 [Paeniclostridium sordellii 8483]
MDFETKVKLLKEKYGFEECGDRRLHKIDDELSNLTEKQKEKVDKMRQENEKYSFLLRYDKDITNDENPIFYSEEYIRNNYIEKILNPFNFKK